MHVTIVRVENEWHAFSDLRAAWDFYCEWKQYRDCEFHGDIPVDVQDNETYDREASACVLVCGNPGDGFSLTGPFYNGNDASEYGDEHHKNDEYWVFNLISPQVSTVNPSEVSA